MTEKQWAASREPADLLAVVRRRASARKLYLLCVACGTMYRFNPTGQEAMAALERAAEADDARAAVDALAEHYPDYGLRSEPWDMAVRKAKSWRVDVGRKHAPPLIRDVFGNPFRTVPFSPEWRTETARVLAQQMYDARDFSALPILADALQDAGCESAEVLDHCRRRPVRWVQQPVRPGRAEAVEPD